MSLEDAGFCKKGEIGPFFDAVDTTYKGSFPVNTDGGQISAGQPVGKVIVFAADEKVGEGVAVAAFDLEQSPTASSPPTGRQPIDDVAEVLGLLMRTMFGSFL